MYDPQAWQDEEAGGTPITAAALNYMETGIDQAHDIGEAAQAAAGAAQNAADTADQKATNALISGNVQVNPAGLIVVNSNNVQGALAQLDAWAAGRPIANPPGVLANRPVAGTQPNGSTYYATDDNGGQRYLMAGGQWVKDGPAVGDASGKSLAYVELPASWASGNVAAGNADIDIAGMQIAFNSGIRPFRVELNWNLQFLQGTAALNAAIRLQIKIQLLNADLTRTNQVTATINGTAAAGQYSTSMCRTSLIVPPANATPYTFLVSVANNMAGSSSQWFGRNLAAITSLEAVER